MSTGSSWWRRRDERGVVGGAEGLAFAFLILFAGSVVIVNTWSMIETRAALDAAARDYLRTYTEQSEPDLAASEAESAARDLLEARGTPLADLRIDAPDPNVFGPCSDARVELRVSVPSIRVPFVADLGSAEVTVSHRELVDAHREVSTGDGYDRSTTQCADS